MEGAQREPPNGQEDICCPGPPFSGQEWAQSLSHPVGCPGHCVHWVLADVCSCGDTIICIYPQGPSLPTAVTPPRCLLGSAPPPPTQS